jgi:hypothetical protein
MLNLLIPITHAGTFGSQAWSGDCIGFDDVPTIQGITCVLRNLLAEIPPILTLVAFFMVIMAGIRLMMAGSEPKAIAAAWSTLTMALIGLFLMAGAWIALVLIETFTGAKVTTISFPGP